MKYRSVALLFALLLLAPSGAEAKSTVSKRPVAVSKKKARQKVTLAASVFYRGMNRLVNDSAAGLRGEVVGATAPRWNSAAGDPWTITQSSTIPYQYRDVSIRVTQVVFAADSRKQDFSVGMTIRVRQYTALSDSIVIEVPVGSFVNSTTYGGEVAVGDRVVFLVEDGEWPFRDGTRERALTFSDREHGVWVDQNAVARSVDPGRSTSVAHLLDRIREERAEGRDPNRDTGTAVSVDPVDPVQSTTIAPHPTVPVPPPVAVPEVTYRDTVSGVIDGRKYVLRVGLSPITVIAQLTVDGALADGVGYAALDAKGVPSDDQPRVLSLTKAVGTRRVVFGLVKPDVRSVVIRQGGTPIATPTLLSSQGTTIRTFVVEVEGGDSLLETREG